MIPKTNRISRENFEKVMKKGGLANSGLFSLRFLKSFENKGFFSVVVSKKVAKTAVARNKIRRRGYAVLARSLKNPYFIILFAKKGAEKATFAETEAEIQTLLEKAKIDVSR